MSLSQAKKSLHLLSMQGERKRESQRQTRSIDLFTTVLVLALFAYGIWRIVTMSNNIVGWLEIVMGFILIVNAILYRKHRDASLTYNVLTVIFILISLAILPSGGVAGTSIYWMFAFPSTIYLFQGLWRGTLFNIIYIALMGTLTFLTHIEMVEMYYSTTQLIQMLITISVIASIGSITARTQETFRHSIASQRERLRVLLENFPAGVIMFDAKSRRPTLVNDTAETFLGCHIDPEIPLAEFPRAYGFTKESGKLFPADDLPVNQLLEGETISYMKEVLVIRPDGSNIYLRMSASPIHDEEGNIEAVVAILSDMTREHEINRLKTELVSLASHQLQSPLTGIRWTTAMVLDDDDTLSKSTRKHLEKIDGAVTRLQNFVSDLLDVSRIEAAKDFEVNPEPTDVIPLIHTISDDMMGNGIQHGVAIKTDQLPDSMNLMLDKEKFREVLTNLLSNALKYSDKGETVRIAVEEHPEFGEVLTVVDDGIGIPDDEQDRIFGRFFRASNVSSETAGTGLGLYIVKKIVEMHEGRIWFESDHDNGTTFFLYFPPATD